MNETGDLLEAWYQGIITQKKRGTYVDPRQKAYSRDYQTISNRTAILKGQTLVRGRLLTNKHQRLAPFNAQYNTHNT